MRTRLAALTVGLLLLGAAPAAMADTGGQTADQSAGSRQFAGSDATSVQRNPTNSNISVRIHSPGNNGSVSQTNSSSADSNAANENTAKQMLAQMGAGSTGQDASQGAWNGQSAGSKATSVQYDPSNEAISVRIHSPGNDGDVSQANDSSANSAAHNGNQTTQGLSQAQGGSGGSVCCSSGPGIQAGSQDAANSQRADSSANSTQYHPSNENVSVRIHSPGDNGSVSQTNSSSADSSATNDNSTTQDLRQTQAGGGGPVVLEPLKDVSRQVPGTPCCGSGSGIQAASQDAFNWQDARSDATSTQYKPSNENSSVSVPVEKPVPVKGADGSLTPMDAMGGGDVTQANNSSATSNASNSNITDQRLEQAQAGSGLTPVLGAFCCTGKPQVQAASQDAKNMQMARSKADSLQVFPLNENDGGFGFGSLSQSNTSDASSEGANTNALIQRMSQLLGVLA